ncbi:GntR family transcriptional regulator [Mangrovibacterium diazotrophicum]|uniref:GntR family transcriptional regulator n=1 Tax=Mangrovibacterium diazotrophicum TaxID=1261403 RepID=A0A419W3Y4_9BACT|nr:GntR family transcriptional regulator [Mangrovibacterium diazotrophicum]RKD90120.1 GntR family transcriptional regulator [Mangrovibacterium diazotrophicum]
MGFQFSIDEGSAQTKIQQLLHAVNEAISNGVLREGDFLPSVNQLSKSSGLSRDTIFKAYRILKQRSIISSTPTKGYFVNSASFKVMMLLDDFSAFKEQLYGSFRANLPDNYVVDLLFHHYNPDVFEQLIQNSLGRYSMYVVMNIKHHRMEKVVRKIDPNKLLILDMGTPDNPDIAYLNQDFANGAVNCLEQVKDRLTCYRKFNLVFPKTTPHPSEFVNSFISFCNDNDIVCNVIEKLTEQSVQSGEAYFVIKEEDLVYIVKSAKKQQLILGKDIGMIAYNDSPLKELVGDGITVISVDFAEMGKKAAHFVESKEKLFETLPPKLILRGSL